MGCYQGPGYNYENHWDVYEGNSYSIMAKWHTSNWLLVEMDDSRTRTKCCWVDGSGDVNTRLSALREIDYLVDRIKCDLSDPQPATDPCDGLVAIREAGFDMRQQPILGYVACCDLSRYGWHNQFTSDGDLWWELKVSSLFGSNNPAFSESEAERECPNLDFP
jgi:hypothetical protein